MKIRNGFISNSSSSSFVAFMKKDVWEKAIADYDPEFRKLLEYAATYVQLGADKFVKFLFESREDWGTIHDWMEDYLPDGEDPYDKWDQINELEAKFWNFIRKLPEDAVLKHEEYR